MYISDDIKYVGVNDHDLDLFEGHYHVPHGMAYNSYIILDEKIAIMDSVETNFKDEWLRNIKEELKGKTPDYLVVHHMEPDHSSNILSLMETYPTTKVVASAQAFNMMKNFFGEDFAENRIIVKNGDKLNLGKHNLTFFTAAMVHWPEVISSYEETDGVLFSADAFGKFGANDFEEAWDEEARRYFIGIVGKYGQQVQMLLKQLENLKIKTICPLHGPVISENLNHCVDLYNKWSGYKVEEDGILIAYTSVYGHTKEAVGILANKLKAYGCPKVIVRDLARSDISYAVSDAFRFGKVVLATTTFNGDIFPYMKEFIHCLMERNYQNRRIGIIENGSWAPAAKKVIQSMFESCTNIRFTENSVTIKSALNENSLNEIDALAKELCLCYSK